MSSAGERADMQDNLKSKDLIGRCVLRIQGQSIRSQIRPSDISVGIPKWHSAEMRAMGVAMAPLSRKSASENGEDLSSAEVQ